MIVAVEQALEHIIQHHYNGIQKRIPMIVAVEQALELCHLLLSTIKQETDSDDSCSRTSIRTRRTNE